MMFVLNPWPETTSAPAPSSDERRQRTRTWPWASSPAETALISYSVSTGCHSAEVTRDGRDDTQPERQRYKCHGCGRRFDDLTDTVFAGHHQPLRVWILCLYFMGLNLSNEQIARELGIDPDDAQVMASQLREGIVARKPEVQLSGEVECDEVYVVAGHKGHPAAVAKKGGLAGAGG